ncbi:MAG: guanylate kinase [Planctomycetota bacterium]|jgi:guanylate kinase
MAGQGILLVLSGPSGAGKTTLARRLCESDGCDWVPTCTTRPMRTGEADGQDYHFLTRGEFEARIARGELLEHAEVHGCLYGTPKQAVLNVVQEGRIAVVDIDVQGARQVKDSGFPALFLFIDAPSREELVRRIRGRKTDSPEAIERRLKTAEQEIAQKGMFDAVVVNDEVDAAVDRILDELRGRGHSV